MGSTFKMGAGMNVQDRLVALHDLDAPWRPGDLEQRSGRIIRQGNRNKQVHIFRYVTEATFAESVDAVKQRRDALSAQITSAEKRLNEIAVLQKHITNYLKTKDIYAGYRASGYSKAYYEEHEDAIKLCKASKRAFDELLPFDTSGKTAGSHKKQLPSLNALRAEYAELLAMKKAAYPEYYRAKDEYRELLTYQANLAGLFGIENVRSAPQREHQQEEK